MDRAELKHTLHEQFVPFEQAVANKLEYLQGDNVFAVDEEPINQISEIGDDSLEKAFNMTLGLADVPIYKDLTVQDVKKMQVAPQPQNLPESPNQDNIAAQKQNIAAKIAALRGISMPGDYLRKK
jgi:hypothetical protein